jgi:L-amino acid N-acyltransferase YncA
VSTYYSTRVALAGVTAARAERFEEVIRGRDVTVRPLDLERFGEDVAAIHGLSLEAFAENFLYTPIALNQVVAMYDKVRPYMDPRYVLLCESADGVLQGFIFCIPDHYSRAVRRLVIKTVAVRPDRRARGIGSYLVERVHALARSDGYAEVIHALMHEDNISTKILAGRSTAWRRYLLYGREL